MDDIYKKDRQKRTIICILIGILIGHFGYDIYAHYNKNKKSNAVKIESETKNVQVLWEEKSDSFKGINFFEKDLPIRIVKIKIENNEYYMIINSLNQCHILPIVMRGEQNENKK